MRISAWSSDLCSSDLTSELTDVRARVVAVPCHVEHVQQQLDLEFVDAMIGEFLDRADGDRVQDRAVVGEAARIERGDVVTVDEVEIKQCVLVFDREIGRASWRERGCHYV